MEMTSSASLPKKSIHAERSVTIKKAMSYGLNRSRKKILMGRIMKYMVILLRHNMYDRLWWPDKTDKAGLKDSKFTKYETESKIHWSDINSFSIP
jgi:hypothetical protein